MVPARLLRRRHAAGIRVERRMPARFDRAELGGAVRRGPGLARRARDGRRAGQARRARTAAHSPAHAALRSIRAGSGLHQELSAGSARERRPVHARGALGRDGARQARQRRRSRRALPSAQSDQPHADAGAACDLQGRAVRGRGRRLRSRAAFRPRRVDVVHRIGRMDVPDGSRKPARPSEARRRRFRSIRASRPSGPRSGSPAGSGPRSTRSRWSIRTISAAASARPSWMASRSTRRAIPILDDRRTHEVRVVLGPGLSS